LDATARKDSSNTPYTGWDEGKDINVVGSLWPVKVSDTVNSDANGYITTTKKPLAFPSRMFDINDNPDFSQDIVATDSNGNPLYHKNEVDAKAGTVKLYTDAGYTSVAASLNGIVVNYWVWVPMKGNIQADGTFLPDMNIPNGVGVVESIETVNDAPVTGVKTVTATAVEIFAGGSAKTNRRKLIVKNEDQLLRLRIGKSDVTQQNGYPVEPGATVEFQFDPDVAVPIYAISEGANLEVAVMEI